MSQRNKIKLRKSDIETLGNRCQATIAELHNELGNVTRCNNGLNYAFRPTDGATILAVAHCDTVNCGSNHFAYSNGLAFSSKLDDRLGVFTLLDMFPKLGIVADILLTDGEESCNSTARYFTTDRSYNWIVQFDRRGTDVVTYQYRQVEKHLREFWPIIGNGSYTDVADLDSLGVCGFNVACGYHNEHSLGSYAVMSEYRQQLRRFLGFYRKYKNIRIPYSPIKLKARTTKRAAGILRYADDSVPSYRETEILADSILADSFYADDDFRSSQWAETFRRLETGNVTDIDYQTLSELRERGIYLP